MKNGQQTVIFFLQMTTLCKKSNDVAVGEEAFTSYGHLVTTFPVSRGCVTDWSSMEIILDAVYERLNIKPDEKSVFLTEPPLNPKSHRETAAEVNNNGVGIHAFF